MIEKSVFKKDITSFEIKKVHEVQQELAQEKDNLKKVIGKISSDHSCTISGLKCLLEEIGQELVSNLSEDFFNLNAKPFKPKPGQD